MTRRDYPTMPDYEDVCHMIDRLNLLLDSCNIEYSVYDEIDDAITDLEKVLDDWNQLEGEYD